MRSLHPDHHINHWEGTLLYHTAPGIQVHITGKPAHKKALDR